MATLLVTIMMIFFMVQLFPYTGLARILSIPATIVVNLTIITVGILLTRKMKLPRFVTTWIIIVIITGLNTITFHPQEFSPPVYKQIGHSISAIKHYDKIKKSSLHKPIESRNVAKVSPDYQTPQEYIAALHKFRHEIPLDGSFVLNHSVDKFGVDPAIRNIDEIPDKLVGHYEILWRYLDKFK